MNAVRDYQVQGLAALLVVLIALVTAGTPIPNATAASGIRLVMVEEPGCRFCRKWDAEIASGYSKSAEGRFAPLRRVRRGAPEIKSLAPVVFTPTFIVLRSGEELGRITGYPGAEYFYGELRPILAAAGFFPGL
ncbi:hypothetical protein [Hyphomicrobium sp. CS1GBMeth3]|uniref:hypothetical protein n=1 Tax=Hyphomicrobium sp. CS1GBMeth3 TaxID=1892845 RepID=UPI0009313F21|nr:hypothetical protein [Hyphomicrobium sp. CS1GBMeth3]